MAVYCKHCTKHVPCTGKNAELLMINLTVHIITTDFSVLIFEHNSIYRKLALV